MTAEAAPESASMSPVEKAKPNKRLWVVVIIVGLVLTALAGLVGFNSTLPYVTARVTQTIAYIKEQALVYDSYNDASEAQCALRALENAGQLARNLSSDKGDLSGSTLKRYVDELRLTGAIVLDASGDVEAQYSNDEVDASTLQEWIGKDVLLNVAEHPFEAYAVRANLPDGSYVDIAAACRSDAPGIAVAYYHTDAAFADKYMLVQQNLLDGYDTARSGTIVIECEGRLVAANDPELVQEAAQGDIELRDTPIQQLKTMNVREDKLSFVWHNAHWYAGAAGQVRCYYIYVYVPVSLLMSQAVQFALTACAAYIVVVAVIVLRKRNDDRLHYEQSLKREKEYNEHLALSANAAQAANNAKTVFLQRMSHDIRTPINGIRGMVEIADSCPDDMERQAQCRRKIWDASTLLLNLVNEILDTSKLESGEITLVKAPINVGAMNAELVQIVESHAAGCGVKVLLEEDFIQHPNVLASPTHLKRLLLNLLSNAVKYNRPGGMVTLGCKETSYSDGVVMLQYTCSDTGIGMSEEFQSHVFEPFACEGRVTPVQGSNGLGLSIAKGLAEHMGGSISFTSKEGEGTTFVLVLPFETTDQIALNTQEARPDPMGCATVEGMRVLVAEDNDLNREIAEFMISAAGAHPVCVSDGAQALATFESSAPWEFDAVLLDIMMPVMDGFETVRAIRGLQRPDAANVPIFAITANAFADDVRHSFQAGFTEHLSKPLDWATLVGALQRAHTVCDQCRQAFLQKDKDCQDGSSEEECEASHE